MTIKILSELLASDQTQRVLNLLNDSINSFIERFPNSKSIEVVQNLSKALIINSANFKKIERKELFGVKESADQITINQINKNILFIIEELPVDFWNYQIEVSAPKLAPLRILILSAKHFNGNTALVKGLKNSKMVADVEIERWSVPNLKDTNVIFINPEFRNSSDETKELIEEIRKYHPEIVFVLTGCQKQLDIFILNTNNRFKHYYRFEEDNESIILNQGLETLLEYCYVEIGKNQKNN